LLEEVLRVRGDDVDQSRLDPLLTVVLASWRARAWSTR
jgi:hypothetical protein